MKKRENRGAEVAANKDFRYTFRLDAAQNEQLLQMMREAGCGDNKTKFILSRLFGWTFAGAKTDDTARPYYARLNNFYYQFRQLGNNYNQVVKAIHQNFDPVTSRKMLYTLEKLTVEMTRLQEQIISFTDEFNSKWSR